MGTLLSWLGALSAGLVVTLEISGVTLVLTIILSALLALLGLYPAKPVRALASSYIELFRSIPLLALLFFLYYGLGSLAARAHISPTWLAAGILTMSESAYLGAVYRATLQAIPRTQWEAAASLGLPWRRQALLVILPQAIPAAIPSTVNAAIGIVKDSSLVSIIAVNELTLSATSLVSTTFEPFQVYLVLAGLYLAMIIPMAVLSRYLERKVSVYGVASQQARSPRLLMPSRPAPSAEHGSHP